MRGGEMYNVNSNDFDDLYFDDQDSRPTRQPLRVNLPQPTKTVWVTKDGRRIPVKQMDDQHLVNTIRMLRRKAPRMMIAEELSLYAYLDSDPPDGAYDCATGALSELDGMDTDEFLESTVPTFPALLAEAEKRGLLEATNAPD